MVICKFPAPWYSFLPPEFPFRMCVGSKAPQANEKFSGQQRNKWQDSRTPSAWVIKQTRGPLGIYTHSCYVMSLQNDKVSFWQSNIRLHLTHWCLNIMAGNSKGIFLQDILYILLQISWKFVAKGPINKLQLVQLMACYRTADQPSL